MFDHIVPWVTGHLLLKLECDLLPENRTAGNVSNLVK